MAQYYVTLAISVEADNKNDAYNKVVELVKDSKDFAIDIDEA